MGKYTTLGYHLFFCLWYIVAKDMDRYIRYISSVISNQCTSIIANEEYRPFEGPLKIIQKDNAFERDCMSSYTRWGKSSA